MSTTPKLDALIDFHANGNWADTMIADAMKEIREHLQRIPVQEPPTVTIVARYPSEAETRLIELCELMQFELACHLSSKCDKFADELATIKRDLGLV